MEDLKEYKLSKQYQFFKANFIFNIKGRSIVNLRVSYDNYRYDKKIRGKNPLVNKDDNGYYFIHLKEKVYFKPYNFYS